MASARLLALVLALLASAAGATGVTGPAEAATAGPGSGGTVAFTVAGRLGRGGGIALVDADATAVRPVGPQVPIGAELAGARQPAWAPDGASLAYAAPPPGTPSGWGRADDVWVLALDGTAPRRLTHDGHNTTPAWAPDGSRIAYTHHPFGELPSIWTVTPDGAERRRLVENAREPAWSPDGSRLAFAGVRVVDGRRTVGLWVAGADGSLPVLVAPYGRAPAWSPDGRRLAFLTNRDRNGSTWGEPAQRYHRELYVADADGGTPLRLTRTQRDEATVTWSPDGARLVFSAAGSRHWEPDADLYVMNADGSCETRLVRDPTAHDTDPAYRPGPSAGSGPLTCAGGVADQRPVVIPPRPLAPVEALRRVRGYETFWAGPTFAGLALSVVRRDRAPGGGSVHHLHYEACLDDERCPSPVTITVVPYRCDRSPWQPHRSSGARGRTTVGRLRGVPALTAGPLMLHTGRTTITTFGSQPRARQVVGRLRPLNAAARAGMRGSLLPAARYPGGRDPDCVI